MTSFDCDLIRHRYAEWLASSVQASHVEDACRISTPFLLPDNTELRLYVELDNDRLLVTDRGETKEWLFLVGANEEASHLRLAELAKRFDLTFDRGEILCEGTIETTASTFHRVATAIIEAASSISTAQTKRDTLFDTEVERFLVHSGVQYEQSVKVKGKSGMHRFSYQLPLLEGVTLIGTLSATTSARAAERAERIAFHALDVRQVESSRFRFGCILDDRSKDKREALTEAAQGPLKEYLDFTIPWSQRHELASQIAA